MSLGHGASVVRSGLVLHLDAANRKSYPGSGTTWSDLSGQGNNGTLVNAVGYNSDNKGGLVFDGTNDYVSVNNSNSINISGDNITLEVIYKSNDLPDSSHGDGLISKGSGANDGQYEILLLRTSTKHSAFFRIQGMGVYSPGSILMDLNKIYMITCVLENKRMRIFINNQEDGAGQLNSNSIVARETSLSIGSRNLQIGSPSSALNGTIYSAKIYNRALSVTEIQQNFNALRGRYSI